MVKAGRQALGIMHTLKNITIGIRSQAAFVLVLTVLWYGSMLGYIGEIGSQVFFWSTLFLLLPFVMLAFEVILLVSYRRAGKPNKGLVRLTVVAAASPWLLLLWVLGVQIY